MQSLIGFSLKNGSVVILATIIVLFAGLFSASTLKQELLPDIKFPVVTVITPYPLAGPDVVETQVSKPLETVLQGLPDLKNITATSNANVSVIVLEFDFNVNLRESESQAAAAVNRVRSSLPATAQNSTVSAVRFGDSPIMQLSLSDSVSAEELKARALQKVVPKIQAVTGVARVDVTGASANQIRVTLDQEKLAQYSIDANSVVQAIQASTLAFPVGQVESDGKNVAVKVDSLTKSISNLASVVVGAVPDFSGAGSPAGSRSTGANTGASASAQPPASVSSQISGQMRAGPSGFSGSVTASPAAAANFRLRPVLLSEVIEGEIELTNAPATSLTRLNDQTSIGLAVFKTQDANTLQVTSAVEKLIPELEKGDSKTDKIDVLVDQGKPISKGVSGLLKEGGLGGLFAVLVVFLFLGNLRSTLVTALSIPLSVLVALLLLQWFGFTLNVLTLGGLTIAIGRVIDDAIVVIENIYHRLAGGQTPLQAALEGASEVVAPVTASTITTVAVFLPLAFVGGIAGEFFRPLALAVTLAILASLVVGFTIIPLLSRYFLRQTNKNMAKESFLERIYRPAIIWVSQRRILTIAIAIVALVASSSLVSRLPTSFVGGGEPTSVEVGLKLPQGTTLAKSDTEARKIEAKLAQLRKKGNILSYQTVVGGADNPFALAFGAGTGAAVSFTVLPNKVKVKVEELRDELEKELKGLGELTFTVGNGGGGFSQNIEVQITADNGEKLRQASDLIVASLKNVTEVRNVKSNLAAEKDELAIRIDQQKAYAKGVIPAAASGAVRLALSGTTATKLQVAKDNEDAQGIEVFVGYAVGNYGTEEKLATLPLKPTIGAGPSVPLGEIASIDKVKSPLSIVRINGQRTVSISAEPIVENLSAANTAVRKVLDGLEKPSGVDWKLGGVTAQQAESFQSLGVAILAAIALVYLIMVATFRSLLTPVLLLVSIPLVAVGAFPLLLLSGTTIGLPVFFGFLLLVGIVVTNAIVLIDRVEKLRENGMNARQAVIEGGLRRVRPIVMTALCTILALLPLALGFEDGGGLVGQPLAITVIGGLTSSTLLTLFVLPALYLAVLGRDRRKNHA